MTIQAQYLNMLKDLQRRTGVALLFITHNLGIVAKMCDRVAVMYAGQIVEQGPVRELSSGRSIRTPRRSSARSRRSAAKEPLYAIPGQPPDLAALPHGLRLPPALPPGVRPLLCRGAATSSSAPSHRASCWLAE